MESRSDKLLAKSKQKQNKLDNKKSQIVSDTINHSENSQYENFLSDGGMKGEPVSDRGSTFQAHAIKINSFNSVTKYLSYLKTHNRISKATHNILAYRITDNKAKKTFTEGFDDDGEDGAGIRLLGFLQKIKVTNVLVVVSRWFGGTLLGNDRFKHINDSCKNLLLQNKYYFDFTD